MECCVQWATGHSRHSPSPLAPPPVPLASMCDAVKLCIQRLSQQLSVAGASIDDISQLQFFLPRYSSGSPLSSEGTFFSLYELGVKLAVFPHRSECDEWWWSSDCHYM